PTPPAPPTSTFPTRRSSDLSPSTSRSRNRSLGSGGRVRNRSSVSHQHRKGIRAQSGTLRISPVGTKGAREFPRRSAGNRNRPPEIGRAHSELQSPDHLVCRL